LACFNCKDSIKEINDIITELKQVDDTEWNSYVNNATQK
jgi:hypothetical protein